MTKPNKMHREHGKVTSVQIENYRGGSDDPNTAWVYLDFTTGGAQGFGGLYLDKKAIKKWKQMLAETFGVEKYEDLKDEPCYALRPWGRWGDNIVGLESAKTGKKFTVNNFRKAMGYPTETYIGEAARRIKDHIETLKRNIAEQELSLSKLTEGYIDWDED